MDVSAVELFGYVASVVVAYSLTQSSIVRLRWINLVGASSFAVYGGIIGAYPVALLNGFIALTNVYFLRKMLAHTEDNFSMLKVNSPSNYVDFFLDFHKQEIEQLFPRFLKNAHDPGREYFFLTEHTEVVGVVSGYLHDSVFIVDFDFVIPRYRDCRLGEFVLGAGQELSRKYGYDRVGATADSREHEDYLAAIGMQPGRNGVWTYAACTR